WNRTLFHGLFFCVFNHGLFGFFGFFAEVTPQGASNCPAKPSNYSAKLSSECSSNRALELLFRFVRLVFTQRSVRIWWRHPNGVVFGSWVLSRWIRRARGDKKEKRWK